MKAEKESTFCQDPGKSIPGRDTARRRVLKREGAWYMQGRRKVLVAEHREP